MCGIKINKMFDSQILNCTIKLKLMRLFLVLLQIFSRYGKVLKIVTFTKNSEYYSNTNNITNGVDQTNDKISA